MTAAYQADVSLGGLVRKDSIQELVRHRDRALELGRQALTLLVEAEREARAAAPQDNYAGFIYDIARQGMYGLRTEAEGDGRDGIGEILAIVRHHVDQHAWGSLMQLSGLRNLMDATAHEKAQKELSDKPPEFVLDNIMATFGDLQERAPEIFERSVVEVFERLDTKHYKTNSAFRIGPRIVLTSMLNDYGFSHWYNKRALVADLDRIFHILDGRKPPEAGNFADLVEREHKARNSVAESEYFHARLFRGNGNMHVKFLRRDLLDKANDVIARHYGRTLADDRKAA